MPWNTNKKAILKKKLHNATKNAFSKIIRAVTDSQHFIIF